MSDMSIHAAVHPLLTVVVIGLNEEERLGDALRSAINTKPDGKALEVIYVDSGSRDRSVEIASGIDGVEVLHLNSAKPSAAKARNIGLERVSGPYVQFLDGDSVLLAGWLDTALDYLEAHPDVACVFGQCLEMHPEQSIYMHVCGLDWHVPPGEYRLAGGNAMWRRSVFDAVGLFDDTLRLGEEPDLCYRVRQQGWRIVCIDAPMVTHDLGMVTFAQYWQRAENSGKAYARVAARYWRNSEKLWLYETWRNFIEPMVWVLVFAVGAQLLGFAGGVATLAAWWLVRGMRTAVKVRSRTQRFSDALLYGLHTQFIKLPVAIGQLKSLVSNK